MMLKKNPTSPGQRHVVLIDKTNLTKNTKLIKPLTKGLTKKGGRNSLGRITVRHKGGGHKKIYRKLNFKYNTTSKQILSLEYDPNRSGHIAKVLENNKLNYILIQNNCNIGDDLIHIKSNVSGEEDVIINPGSFSYIKNIPSNYEISNVELYPGKGGQLARSAGSSIKIIEKNDKYVKIVLPSGRVKQISPNCHCTVGHISNEKHRNIKLGKAGRSRWLGIRPSVRGVAMNPVDHPHGGGQGKTSGGRPSVTPWGVITKGKPTVKYKK